MTIIICIYIVFFFICLFFGKGWKYVHIEREWLCYFPMKYVAILSIALYIYNTLRLRQNNHRFADGILKHIFLRENWCILIKIS